MAVPDQRPPYVTSNAWPGASKQQHQCLALSVVAANIDPHHRLRGIFGGLLLLFRLLSRCLSGSSHKDQREADHQQRQNGPVSTEGHPIFRTDVSDDVSDDLHAFQFTSDQARLATRSGELVLHARHERRRQKLEAVASRRCKLLSHVRAGSTGEFESSRMYVGPTILIVAEDSLDPAQCLQARRKIKGLSGLSSELGEITGRCHSR
jgi:hypothetical protein